MKESCKNCVFVMKTRIFYQEEKANSGKLKCGCLSQNRTPAWLESIDDLEYVGCDHYAKERKAEQLSMFG